MPRLSIIIPHRRNDAQFEATVLSVLENQPRDSEVIVVHDGSYADPYKLDGELLFVECQSSDCVALLNAGLMAACAPHVCTVLDGVQVSPDWVENALQLLEDPGVAAVALRTELDGESNASSCGIDARRLANAADLQRGLVAQVPQQDLCAGPELACGCYRTKILRALGGWNSQLSAEVADVDLAWTLQALGMNCACTASGRVTVSRECKRNFSNASMKQLAALAVAYGVCAGGATAAMSDLLRACLSGNISLAVAWSSGVMGSRATELVAARLRSAEQRVAALPPTLRVFAEDELSYRRNAA